MTNKLKKEIEKLFHQREINIITSNIILETKLINLIKQALSSQKQEEIKGLKNRLNEEKENKNNEM